jgi:hypothetical protein
VKRIAAGRYADAVVEGKALVDGRLGGNLGYEWDAPLVGGRYHLRSLRVCPRSW